MELKSNFIEYTIWCRVELAISIAYMFAKGKALPSMPLQQFMNNHEWIIATIQSLSYTYMERHG